MDAAAISAPDRCALVFNDGLAGQEPGNSAAGQLGVDRGGDPHGAADPDLGRHLQSAHHPGLEGRHDPKLFEDEDPTGHEILLNAQRFAVTGSLEAKGESWSSPDDQIFVPLSTAQARLFGVTHLSSILAQMGRADDFEAALFDIESILRRSHRLR